MVEMIPASPDGEHGPGWYHADLRDVPEAKRQQVAGQMALVGEILADGQVTMEEGAQLLAMAYPDLAGHPQLASVLEAADLAVKALLDDGKVSLPEALTIMLTLLSGVPSLSDLAGAARAVTQRLLALRSR